jgi:raffinose/stachyose/melibiose transport system permease protein
MAMDRRRRIAITVTLFLLPGGLLYSALVLNPLIQGFILAMYRWRTLSNTVFVGLENFVTVFKDSLFWRSMKVSGYFMLGTTVLQVTIGFLFGYFLYMQLKGHRFFKTVYFIPVVMATIAVGAIWGTIYSPTFSAFKPIVEAFGGTYQSPLASPGSALFAVILAQTWHFAGIQIMLFNAGFMNMPQDVIEMASIDGASGLKMIYHMVLPLAWEITKAVIILQVIGSLRAFDLVFVMTVGGPNHATAVLPMHMFVRAFENFQIGLGSVVAVVIFVLAMGLTMILRKIMGREALQY